MIDEIQIAGTKIGPAHAPFIIGEVSGNHMSSKSAALELVTKIIEAGASAIKLQTYTADTMTLNIAEREFMVGAGQIWSGRSLYGLYKEAATPWEWHREIFDLCKQHRVPCFSSSFDESAVDFLESLDTPAYKIASFECIDLPLIRKVAQTGKPTIISTGMATLSEIGDAVDMFYLSGGKELILLKCTSSYPASPKTSNLKTIAHMGELFKCQVGLSDHTLGIGVPLAAIALGATVVEKHVTLSKTNGAVDSLFSSDPEEFAMLVRESKATWESVGLVHYGVNSDDEQSRKYRRSLYISEDLRAGDELSSKNLRRVRPGEGLPPKFYDVVLGKRVNKPARKGTPLSWDLIA
jgi:pseudaminic acid synthase